MTTFLKRMYYTFLMAHTHVKPTLEGKGWQVIHANVFISFVDDAFVYSVSTAWHNFKVTVGQLWGTSAGEMGGS